MLARLASDLPKRWLTAFVFGALLVGSTTLSPSGVVAGPLPDATTPTTAPAPTSYSAVVLTDNPAAYWRLSEAAGSTSVADATGYGHAGTPQGGVRLGAAGLIGADPAATFDGVSGQISIANTAGLPSGGSPYSLEAWINSDIVANQGILGMGEYGHPRRFSGLRTIGSRGLLNYWWEADLAAQTVDLRGAWHHVMATFDGMTRRLYLDGAQVAQDTPGTPEVVSSNLRLGLTCCDEYFGGRLDEVALYSTALDATRVQTHYQAGKNYATSTPFATQGPLDSATSTQTPTALPTPTASPLPTSAPAPAPVAPAVFVARLGTAFALNGAPFPFVGANLYNAAGDPTIYECGPWMGDPDRELDTWLAHARNDYGASVVRFWAFQSYTRGGTNWQALDRVMRLARQHGLKVIPVLENQWADCTAGGYKFASWYAAGYLVPYDAYPLSYRDYVGRVVQRYRDEPAVAAWSLMNEAESQTRSGVEDPEALYTFARDMSAYVKNLDSNHLVTLGVIGSGQPGVRGDQYQRLHELPSIDVAEYHDGGASDEPLPGAPLRLKVPLTSAIFTIDAAYQWRTEEYRRHDAHVWETWSATVADGASPAYRLGVNFYGAFTGDVYVDSIALGSRVFDFEDGTTQGWSATSPIEFSNAADPTSPGNRLLKLTFSRPTRGAQLFLSDGIDTSPGTPLSLHVYVDGVGSPDPDDTLAADLYRMQQLGKPLIVAQAWIDACSPPASGTMETLASRAHKFDAKIGAFLAQGGAGYLIWGWDPKEPCGRTFTSGDPLNDVLSGYAGALAGLRGRSPGELPD